jgi:hypothetical protein
VRHLEEVGLRCVYAGDIATGQDALALTIADCNNAHAIITNPPFIRGLLERLIPQFSEIAPTWLLLPADWMHNLYAARFLPSCTDIVSVGRVRWFEGTKMSSMENFAWHRFCARHSANPILHARDSALPLPCVSLCAQCGKPYRPQRSDSKFCSDTCRQHAHRRRLAVTKRDASLPGWLPEGDGPK